jgi:hypothetical protein
MYRVIVRVETPRTAAARPVERAVPVPVIELLSGVFLLRPELSSDPSSRTFSDGSRSQTEKILRFPRLSENQALYQICAKAKLHKTVQEEHRKGGV